MKACVCCTISEIRLCTRMHLHLHEYGKVMDGGDKQLLVDCICTLHLLVLRIIQDRAKSENIQQISKTYFF